MIKTCQNHLLHPFMLALSVLSLSSINAMERNTPLHERVDNVKLMNVQEGETFFFFPPLDLIIDSFKKNHDSPGGLESSIDGVITHVDYEKVNFKCVLVTSQRYAIFTDKWKSWGYETILDYLLPMSTNYRESTLSSKLPLLYPAIYRKYGGGILSVYPIVESTKFIRIALPLGSCEKKVNEFSYAYRVKKNEEYSFFDEVPSASTGKKTPFYYDRVSFLISHRDFGKKTLKMILLMKGTVGWQIPKEIYRYLYNILDYLNENINYPQNQFYAFTLNMGTIKEVRQHIKNHNNQYSQRCLRENQ